MASLLRFRPAAVLLVPTFSLASCADPCDVDRPATTLVIASDQALAHLLPGTAQSAMEGTIVAMVDDELFDLDDHGQIIDYAGSVVQFDGRTLEVALRPGWTWSDGKPVTVADFSSTVKRRNDPAYQLPSLENVVTLTTRGEHLLWTFTKPLPRQFAMKAVADAPISATLDGLGPAEFAARDRWPEDAVPDAPNNGRWRVVSRTETEVALEPNPGHPGTQPELHRVVFEKRSAEAQLAALRTCEVDVLPTVGTDQLASVPDDHYRVVSRGFQSLDVIVWNLKSPILADPALRRALSRAVDRTALAGTGGRYAGDPLLAPATSPVPPQYGGGAAPEPGEAPAATLARLGWTDSDGNGVRDRAGSELVLRVDVEAGWDAGETFVRHVQADLAAVGVRVDVHALQRDAIKQDEKAGEFDGSLHQYGLATPFEPARWTGGNPANLTGGADAEVDRSFAAARESEGDPQTRWQAFGAAVRAWQPGLFLVWGQAFAAVHRRVEGFQILASGVVHHVETWRAHP